MSEQENKVIVELLRTFNLSEASLPLLQVALTHSSYAHENQLEQDNERLEFLGDAVLSFVVAEYLYYHFPEADEGELTGLRRLLVNQEYLAQRARHLNLGELLLLGKGEEQSGGRERESNLARALEAVIGAIFLSEGSNRACDFVCQSLIEPVKKRLPEGLDTEYKSRLQELLAAQHKPLPDYTLVEETGPDHAKTFRIQVYVEGECLGEGMGKRKKEAENLAARQALEKLEGLEDTNTEDTAEEEQ